VCNCIIIPFFGKIPVHFFNFEKLSIITSHVIIIPEVTMSSLKLQKRLAASVMKCGKNKVRSAEGA
jgi:hypothetical protein